MTCSLQNVI